jgi:hypothetical protein
VGLIEEKFSPRFLALFALLIFIFISSFIHFII